MHPKKIFTAFIALSLLGTGCNLFQPRPAPVAKKGTGPIAERQAGDFVDYLNRNAASIQTLRYNDVNLKVEMPGQFVPGLNNGMIVCGQPNNFRMTAALAVGGKQLDIGSNAKEMWMYVKMSEEPFLYCSHSEFAKVQDRLPVKFEPNWVMQSLGMMQFAPKGDYSIRVNEKERTYQLIYSDITSTGQPVMKVIEFNADIQSGNSPQVRRHTLMTRDMKTVIAEAKIRKVQEQLVGRDPQTNAPVVVQVPTEVSLEWVAEKVKMDLILGKIEVNEKMRPGDLENLFAKPTSIGNAKPVNLTDYLQNNRGAIRSSMPQR